MECNLKPGDKVELGTVYRITPAGLHDKFAVDSLLSDKRAVIFGGPAPFSRLDTQQATDYARLGDELLKHVDIIYGIYCQDAFVMKQFDLHIATAVPNHAVAFYGDGDAFFARAHQLDYNFTYQGLSMRTGRYAIITNDKVIEHIVLDEYQLIGKSSAESILAWLKSN